MKKIITNYKQTLILIGALIIGAIAGLVFKEKAAIVRPLGDLFLNMMFVLIIPLIFFTLTTSIAKIKQPKRIGKVLGGIFGVFIITSLVAVTIGLIGTYSFKLVDNADHDALIKNLGPEESTDVELNILERTVSVVSVNDFSKILSKENIVALVVFAIFFGLAINKVGKDAEPVVKFLEAGNKIIMKLVDFAFIYAPIGLGCYFAALIGTFGGEIAVGYLKTFIIYTVLAIVFYFVIYTLYAFIAGGKKGVKAFYKNVLPATATSISTCSSAASIPVNISCAKKIGVSDDIAETIIPLGTSFHKDGSIIGSVFKIMFLAYLFGTNIHSTSGIFSVIGVSLIATLLIAAVPVGGGTISEMLIISMMGFPVGALPILTVIATIIDPPATCLNVVGDTAASMLTARFVDGKEWMNNKKLS